ncbi:hypothetical protein DT075_09380 [Bacillus licheniformis]|nr:hypothetical protein DT075_09380 [Bacillus licheniformis]
MAIPIMMGASLLSLIKNWAYLSADLLPFFIAGFISAFIVALFVVRFFLRLISVRTVAVGLIAGAVLMLAADWINRRKDTTDSVDRMTYKQALGMGLFQCLALWPGFSRSGSTISGGVMIQLGSILAVAIVFKDRILNLLGMKKNITEEQKSGNRLSIAQIAVGLVPAAVLGFLFEDYIDQYLFRGQVLRKRKE